MVDRQWRESSRVLQQYLLNTDDRGGSHLDGIYLVSDSRDRSVVALLQLTICCRAMTILITPTTSRKFHYVLLSTLMRFVSPTPPCRFLTQIFFIGHTKRFSLLQIVGRL
jgi:hypothetical protein